MEQSHSLILSANSPCSVGANAGNDSKADQEFRSADNHPLAHPYSQTIHVQLQSILQTFQPWTKSLGISVTTKRNIHTPKLSMFSYMQWKQRFLLIVLDSAVKRRAHLSTHPLTVCAVTLSYSRSSISIASCHTKSPASPSAAPAASPAPAWPAPAASSAAA